MKWLALLALLLLPLYAEEAFCDEQLYLSLNSESGTYLGLSNGRTYEVAPADRLYCAYWVTPFPLAIGESGDPEYPVEITNLQSGTAVRAKEIDTRAFLEKEGEKRRRSRRPKPYTKSLEPQVPTDQTPAGSKATPLEGPSRAQQTTPPKGAAPTSDKGNKPLVPQEPSH